MSPTRSPGPDEVLSACARSRSIIATCMVTKGVYNPKLKLPMIPISDGAGEVVATGAGVTRFKPGERVVASFMPDWVDGPPDEKKHARRWVADVGGMLAEVAVLPSRGWSRSRRTSASRKPPPYRAPGVTAWNALFESGGIKPGDTVLVQGTGGVSLFALQFARLAGAGSLRPRAATRNSSEPASSVRPTASITRRRPTGTSGSAS